VSLRTSAASATQANARPHPSHRSHSPGNSSFGWIGVVGRWRAPPPIFAYFSNVLSVLIPAILSVSRRDQIQAKKLHNLRIGVLDSHPSDGRHPNLSRCESRGKTSRTSRFPRRAIRAPQSRRALDLWWFFFGPVIAQLFVQQVAGKNRNSANFSDYFGSRAHGSTDHDARIHHKIRGSRFSSAARILKQWKTSPFFCPQFCSAPAFPAMAKAIGVRHGYRETMRHAQWLNLAGLPGLSAPLQLR